LRGGGEAAGRDSAGSRLVAGRNQARSRNQPGGNRAGPLAAGRRRSVRKPDWEAAPLEQGPKGESSGSLPPGLRGEEMPWRGASLPVSLEGFRRGAAFRIEGSTPPSPALEDNTDLPLRPCAGCRRAACGAGSRVRCPRRVGVAARPRFR
jgi:hypothetical protein